MKKKLSIEKFAARAKRILAARERGRAEFERSDLILNRMVRDFEIGTSAKVGKQIVALVDQFALKSVVYRPVGVRRFDLVAQKLSRKQAKA